MSTVFAERPNFFEGQYLGADDLEAFLKYAKEYDARHLLGAHTWGVITGIELMENTSPTGDVEYFLTPGVAVDGYGRLIVVTTPFKLTTDLFSQQPSGTVDVWIHYEEESFGGTRPGFQSCECSDAFVRVAESFVVEVGPRTAIDQRESGILVGDETFVDAREALGAALPGQPLACDGAVAAQTFPDAEARDLWLIPVGRVPWSKATSSLLAVTETDRKASLIFRRVAGLVTGHIYPASGVIRMRPRWSARQAGVSADQICALSAIKEADLVTCKSTGALSFREMIWLEGHSRFTGDARMYGSRLEFQEALGTDYLNNGVPLAVRRRPDRNEHHGFDLQILLGEPQGTDGPTRLTIGKATVQGDDPCAVDFQFEPSVYIQQDAKLGIGTVNTLLTLPLTIHAVGDTGDLAGFEAGDGVLAWQMNFGANKNGLNFTETNPTETRLFLRTGGNIGIGTLTPEAKLDIRNMPASGNALGAGKWFQVGDGGDNGRMWLQYGDQLAPLLVLSDLDDPPRLQFQQTGIGQETGPQFLSWIGHARKNSADLSLMGGNVGIATDAPAERLDVRGNIKLGANGNFFGLGCLDNLRMIAGRVNSNGNLSSGSGYSVARIATGRYRVSYSDAFMGIPVVVATLVDSINEDNFLTVVNSSTAGFDIIVKDDDPADNAGEQESAFNFIALGSRA